MKQMVTDPAVSTNTPTTPSTNRTCIRVGPGGKRSRVELGSGRFIENLPPVPRHVTTDGKTWS
ncbi:hypothetical protein KW790_01720 [Candidatus Parcubacteria bacterium]|nr:hypothetical protein [Candidatus Parcubacteria bacterium]